MVCTSTPGIAYKPFSIYTVYTTCHDFPYRKPCGTCEPHFEAFYECSMSLTPGSCGFSATVPDAAEDVPVWTVCLRVELVEMAESFR